jgi:uncharacterized protein (TIGR00156 family)
MVNRKETAMRSRLRYAVTGALAALAAAGCSTYSDRPRVTSAEQVMDSTDDRAVSLRGQIVRQPSGDHYVVNDGTREVLVEIKDHVRDGQRLAPGMRVEINGEVETRAFKEPKVEARDVTVLAASGARGEPPEYRWPEEQLR